MKTLQMGSIQTGLKLVNALDIGMINDGKTDCSKIINEFLSNKKNGNKILFIPKGEYYFKDTINIDGNFASFYIEPDSIIHSDGDPCFCCIGKMSEHNIKKNLVALYCYDTEGVDAGIKDEVLKERIKRILEKKYYEDDKSVDRLISSLLYEQFLNEEKINEGYGIEDAKSFLDWFEIFL